MPLIDADNLAWTPPDSEIPIFRNADIDLRAGEVLLLHGPSGSGKSTLLRCLVGLQDRGNGTIRWRGDEIYADNIRAYRRRVVYLHQEPVEVDDTVGDNLRFARAMADYDRSEGPEPLDKADQQECLRQFRLDDIPESRPFGDLSVGERQRLALVRALTLQPDVLLLDEPTASLGEDDSRLIEDYLLNYLRESPDRRALVWVTHDAEQRERLGSLDRSRSLEISHLNS